MSVWIYILAYGAVCIGSALFFGRLLEKRRLELDAMKDEELHKKWDHYLKSDLPSSKWGN